jgi:hypothetical protein
VRNKSLSYFRAQQLRTARSLGAELRTVPISEICGYNPEITNGNPNGPDPAIEAAEYAALAPPEGHTDYLFPWHSARSLTGYAPDLIFGWDATALKARIATGGPPRREAEHYFQCKSTCFLERVDSIPTFGHCHSFRERVHRAGLLNRGGYCDESRLTLRSRPNVQRPRRGCSVLDYILIRRCCTSNIRRFADRTPV